MITVKIDEFSSAVGGDDAEQSKEIAVEIVMLVDERNQKCNMLKRGKLMATRWTTLYKYVPLEYVESTLDKQRLYLDDGKKFNDPFEVTITDRDKKTIEPINGLHILSLTNSYQNKLMWSHYTKSHEGVCLTVRVPNSLVYPICYTSKRVYTDSNIEQILDTGKIKSKKSVLKPYSSLRPMKRIAFIKDRKWMYENEYRLVFDHEDEPSLIFEDGKWFMPVKITNIYLGVNFDRNDDEIKERIIDACKRNNVKIAQMVLSYDDYSLKIKR